MFQTCRDRGHWFASASRELFYCLSVTIANIGRPFSELAPFDILSDKNFLMVTACVMLISCFWGGSEYL
uniref:Ion_trans domain-containing protein n=1 Tax=Strongyloides papillosus TaxID=174720 RepID=A0A0N5BXG3_STREA